MKKILLAMSGGVDSATAASILQHNGFEVTGVTMKLWRKNGKNNTVCGSPADVLDAAMTAKKLGIEHHVIDLSKEYEELVGEYFKSEYAKGRTPNPCTFCNRHIKFALLVEKSQQQGIVFDLFATGHYANIYADPVTFRYGLTKAFDKKKDQSYFLAFLTQKQLSRTIFPLGTYEKSEIKSLAEKLSLTVAYKKESQDFKASQMFRETIGGGRGNIVDTNGNKLGEHKGIEHFTIGQRKGLGISSDKPLYVLSIDPQTNDIILGAQEYLYCSECVLEKINMMTCILNIGETIRANVKIRYTHKEAPAKITKISEKSLRVKFEEPQKSITPGQAAVIYRDDIVLAAGIIS